MVFLKCAFLGLVVWGDWFIQFGLDELAGWLVERCRHFARLIGYRKIYAYFKLIIALVFGATFFLAWFLIMTGNDLAERIEFLGVVLLGWYWGGHLDSVNQTAFRRFIQRYYLKDELFEGAVILVWFVFVIYYCFWL